MQEVFSTADIDKAFPLFEAAGVNKGMLVLTLECPFDTVVYAVKQANKHGLKVMFDPGGIQTNDKIEQLIQAGIYLIKPNEHEAKILTGVEVTDFYSAKVAATKLQMQGIKNVLITHGAKGAYLICEGLQVHIPIPKVKAGSEKDETGCGDQTMAALCALLQANKPIQKAAERAILAGTLQFYKSGIRPVTKEELSTNSLAAKPIAL